MLRYNLDAACSGRGAVHRQIALRLTSANDAFQVCEMCERRAGRGKRLGQARRQGVGGGGRHAHTRGGDGYVGRGGCVPALVVETGTLAETGGTPALAMKTDNTSAERVENVRASQQGGRIEPGDSSMRGTPTFVDTPKADAQYVL